MVLELQKFFDVIEKNGLVSGKQLLSLKSALNKETLSTSDFDKLVSGSYLTKWQAQRLLTGKHNFIVGEYKLVDFLGKDEFGEVYQVEHKVSTQRNRLRLLSKEISDDETRLPEYLERVKAFQSIEYPRIPKVIEVTEVGGRNIIVTECPAGQTLVERLAGKRQNSKLVEKLIEKLTQAVTELENGALTHGTINGHSITITDKQKIVLDLPGEIGFCGAPRNKSKSDIASLGWLACGLLSGDFEKPQIAGNQTADKFFEIASHPHPKIEDIRSVLGVSPAVTPEIPPELSPELAPGIPPEMAISTQENSADPALPVENLAGNDAQTKTEPHQESKVDIPQIPNVNADQLESIDRPDEMFGDFDNIEVVSEIQSSQPFAATHPIVVDSTSVSVKPLIKPAKKDKKKKLKSDQKTEPKSSKKILFASLGGVIGVTVIGLSIYFFLRGGDSKTDQVAKSESKENLKNTRSGDADSKTGKDHKKEPGAGQNDEAKENDPALRNKDDSGIVPPVDPQGQQPGNKDGKNKDGKNKDKKNKDPKNLPGTGPGISTGNKPTPQPNPKTTGNPSQGKKGGQNPSPKNLPGEPQKKNPKKDPGKDPGKENKKDDSTINLFNNSDEKKEAENKGDSPSAKFANPFMKTPGFVSLTPAKKGEDNSTVQTLFSLRVPSGFPLAVSLHGGERATKAKIEFTLRASTSVDGTWHVSAGAKGSAKLIAKFTFDEENFEFAWEKEAESLVNSIYLSNCAVEIKAAQYQHTFALRPPVVATQLNFGKSLNASAEAKLDYLPNMESVKIVLVNIPKSLAKFDYPKNKRFLTGRADNSALQFKIANIEYVRGLLSSKLRGSKMSVSLKPHFITRFKVPVPLTTFQQFEQGVKSAINDGNRLVATHKQLKQQYNSLGNNNKAKGQFNKTYGMKEIELQIKEIPRDRDHLDKAVAILKSIHQAKIGIRIYYQAGEVEVDLATPDGKKYTRSGPAPKKPGPAKKKAKKQKAKKK